jgi:hypothetical protein
MEHPKEKDQLGDLGIHRRRTLKWMLNKYDVDWIHLA